MQYHVISDLQPVRSYGTSRGALMRTGGTKTLMLVLDVVLFAWMLQCYSQFIASFQNGHLRPACIRHAAWQAQSPATVPHRTHVDTTFW